jgi:hypothetical protein
MDAVTLNAMVSEDRRLIVDLPDDIPVGPVKLVIQPMDAPIGGKHELTWEEARAKLMAAGRLAVNLDIPDDLEDISDEELEELSKLAAGGRSAQEIIDEDRGEY